MAGEQPQQFELHGGDVDLLLAQADHPARAINGQPAEREGATNRFGRLDGRIGAKWSVQRGDTSGIHEAHAARKVGPSSLLDGAAFR